MVKADKAAKDLTDLRGCFLEIRTTLSLPSSSNGAKGLADD